MPGLQVHNPAPPPIQAWGTQARVMFCTESPWVEIREKGIIPQRNSHFSCKWCKLSKGQLEKFFAFRKMYALNASLNRKQRPTHALAMSKNHQYFSYCLYLQTKQIFFFKQQFSIKKICSIVSKKPFPREIPDIQVGRDPR